MRIRPAIFLFAFCALASIAAARNPTGPFEAFRLRTANPPQADIDCWFLPATNPKGTCFILHGYNNSKEWSVNHEWIRDTEGWNALMLDFRNHGASSKTGTTSTLGYYEIDEVKALVDWADQKNLQRPFVIYGRSMGASTGLRWASMDPRIEGVIAVSPFRNAELATRQMTDYGIKLFTGDKLSRAPVGIGSVVGQLAAGAVESYLDGHNPVPASLKEKLREVDIPKAVANRNDLRIWIYSGESDSFPPEDQRAILDASPSKPEFKRLVVAPGNHRSVWSFKGDAARNIPSHDQYVRDFLNESLLHPPAHAPYLAGETSAMTPIIVSSIIAATLLAAVIGIAIFLKRSRPTIAEPELGPPTNAS